MDNNIISNIAAYADTASFTQMVKALGAEFYDMMKDMNYVKEIDLTNKYGVFEMFVEIKDLAAFKSIIGDGGCTCYEDFSDFEDHYKKLMEPWFMNKTTKGSCLMASLRTKYASVAAGYHHSIIIVYTNKRRFLAAFKALSNLEKKGKVRFNQDFGIRVPLSRSTPEYNYFITVRFFRNKYICIEKLYHCSWIDSTGIQYIEIPICSLRKIPI
jgi:hypothetical protein